MVLPDPIPNSAVKHVCADDSPAHAGAKVGNRPLYEKPLLTEGFFFCLDFVDIFRLKYD